VERGSLLAPVARESLLMSPAERADIVVNFAGLRPGSELERINEGPDEPDTMGQVLMLVVVRPTAPDASTKRMK
jgi:hypothetical protein